MYACACVCVQAALETQLRMRLELQDAHRDYLENKVRRDEAMRLEEEEYRRQMMEKFAEDDRIEQMNAQKRRMKQLGLWRDVAVGEMSSLLRGEGKSNL